MRLAEQLLGAGQVDSFFERHWGREPLHLCGDAGRFKPWLDGDRFFALLAEHGPELPERPSGPAQPAVSMHLAGTRVDRPHEWFAPFSGGWKAESHEQLRRTCSTLQLLYAYLLDDRLEKLVRDAHRDFEASITCNGYYSAGSGSMGVSPHSDRHEVLVLQCEGEHTWHVDDRRSLSRRAKVERSQAVRRDPSLLPRSFRLRPGDLLYVPGGTVHYVSGFEGVPSLHLALGVRCPTGRDVLEWLLQSCPEDALPDDNLWQSGPPGTREPRLVERFQDVCQAQAQVLSSPGAWASFRRYCLLKELGEMWPPSGQ